VLGLGPSSPVAWLLALNVAVQAGLNLHITRLESMVSSLSAIIVIIKNKK